MAEPFTYPDVERLVLDYIEEQFADFEPDVTVGIDVPSDWSADSPGHVQVICDGVPQLDHPLAAYATVRLLARAASTTEAKRLAGVALGLLVAHPGGDGISKARPLTGPLPARDPDTRAELASATARVTVRSIPIVPTAS